MNNQSKFGQMKHGQELLIDLSNPKTNDCLRNVSRMMIETGNFVDTIALALLVGNRKTTLPCKKCLLDTALQFRDIGALLEELANGK